MMKLNRRDFIGKTAPGLLAAGLAPHILGQDKAGRKFRTALIGSGWWGMNIAREAMASGACKMVAVCDVDENMLNPA